MHWYETDSQDVQTVDAYHGGIGKIKTKEFFKGKGTLGFRFVVWELAPGAAEGDQTHEADDNYEETYYFLSGTGAIRIEGREFPVRAGDAFLVPVGVDHGLRNTGGTPLRLALLFGKPPAASHPG